jgi:hypothetical protein
MVLIRKYRVPAYRTRLWVVIGNTVAEGIEHVEDLVDHRIHSKGTRSTRAYMYAFEDHEGKYQVMCFYRKTAKPGEIAHEAKHALNIVFRWHGVALSISNDEPECYYLEWLVDRVHQTIKDFKKIK